MMPKKYSESEPPNLYIWGSSLFKNKNTSFIALLRQEKIENIPVDIQISVFSRNSFNSPDKI